MHFFIQRWFRVILPLYALAAAADFDTYSDDNRLLFLSPRSMAMGGSAASIVADALPTSNPSGLCQDTASRISLNYAGYYQNAFSTGELAFARPLSKNTSFGLSLNYLHIPDIEYNAESTLDPSGAVIEYRSRTVSASEISINAAASRRFLLNRFFGADLGTALHAMRRNLPDEQGKAFTGYGIGLDLGLAVFEKRSGLRLGCSIADATTNYLYWTGDYSNRALPRLYVDLSLTRNIPYVYGDIALCLRSADLLSMAARQKASDSPEAFGLDSASVLSSLPPLGAGIEYTIRRTVAIRAGIDPDKKISFGAGLALFQKKLAIDMAYALPSGLPGTYVLGLAWRW